MNKYDKYYNKLLPSRYFDALNGNVFITTIKTYF